MARNINLLLTTITFVLLGARFSAAIAQAPATHDHSFHGAQQWAGYFDDPKRDEWQKPHEVIHVLALAPNAVVADIGSGTGYFTVRLAHMLPKGRVYGVDTEPDMVKYLAERAKREGLKNVVSHTGKADTPALPVKVDLILMVDVYHHVANRSEYFKKLLATLKPGGRLALIDFNATSPMGPPPSERMAPDKLKADMSEAGYALDSEYSFLPNQYFLVFKAARR